MNKEEFFQAKEQFQLGHLVTEQSHPQSMGLSFYAQDDMAKALAIFQDIDVKALSILKSKTSEIEGLRNLAKKVWSRGGKVFLSGCGATGRLSILLETLKLREGNESEKLIGFMAGGDLALIRSLEKFEDREDFGVKQLEELDYSSKDLVIGVTEGGETSFVIGSTLHAAKTSNYTPYFVYCNPTKTLLDTIERSARVIKDDRVQKVELNVGQMALSGSTRLQASSVQMSFLALALLDWGSLSIDKLVDRLIQRVQYDYTQLQDLVALESQAYKSGNQLVYKTDIDLAVSVLTDTTERSPTFSLAPFENFNDENRVAAWAYLHIQNTTNAQFAWSLMLGRSPRCLEWPELNNIASSSRLFGYDISQVGLKKRMGQSPQLIFDISLVDDQLILQFQGSLISIDVKDYHPFEIHLLLKLLLNAHSTIVMGRMGRYRSNVMTWVRPSNYKLIDRSTRYVMQLLNEKKIEVDYDEVAMMIFDIAPQIGLDESVVLKCYEFFSESVPC